MHTVKVLKLRKKKLSEINSSDVEYIKKACEISGYAIKNKTAFISWLQYCEHYNGGDWVSPFRLTDETIVDRVLKYCDVETERVYMRQIY